MRKSSSRADEYVHISPQRTCAQQARRCAEHLEAAPEDGDRLLDAVRCGHLALMGGMVTALSGSAGIGAYPDKLAAKHLEQMQTRTDETLELPQAYTLAFKDLFARLQEPDRLEFSTPALFSAVEQARALALDGLRQKIDHPQIISWSVPRGEFYDALRVVPVVLEFCRGSAPQRFLDDHGEILREALARFAIALSSGTAI